MSRSGSDPLTWVERPDGSLPWTLWLILLALAFVLFHKGTCDTSIDTAVKRRVLLVLPLFWLLPLIAMAVSAIPAAKSRSATSAAKRLNADAGRPGLGLRLAVTPILLIGDSVFQSVKRRKETSLPRQTHFGRPGQHLFLVALPYLLFVVGPRVAVDPAATGESGSYASPSTPPP